MPVLRLPKDTPALGNGLDWFSSSEYTSNVIFSIADPDGGKGNEPTSIPSPFARLDLANTAFNCLAQLGDDAGVMYQKIVSDCLDVAEIFFNHHIFSNDVNIIEWDRNSDIAALKRSSMEEHVRLADTLLMYFSNKDDAEAFNFNVCDKIYLLEYKHRIIGGTSPLTMFFNTADDLSWTEIIFPNGNKAFSPQACPLYSRSEDFIIWLYSMQKSFSSFNAIFRTLNVYMQKCLVHLQRNNNALYDKICRLSDIHYSTSNYEVITNGIIIVNGLPLFQAKQFLGNANSDFEIVSHKYTGERKPLVLKNGHKGKTPTGHKMRYFNANYDEKIVVPFVDDAPLNDRHLPGLTNIEYPYLTVSDFLEPTIIRTVYPINGSKFFNGNFSSDTKGYILPIKKLYFDFFDISDLQNNISIEQLIAGGIKVNLTVPIANNNQITFERIYYPAANEYQIVEPDIQRNKGSIIENQFSLALYPFLKLRESSKNRYRVSLFDRDILPLTKSNKYRLSFFDAAKNEQVKEKAIKIRSQKETDTVKSEYYVLECGFDYIEIKNKWATGIIIPMFKEISAGSDRFTFAVDFGTTNTHIEYSVGGGDPQPFEIREEDVQLATLHDSRIAEKDRSLNGTGATILLDIISQEIMPETIGAAKEFHFPIRTAIGSHANLDLNTTPFALADLNMSFIYEKYPRAKNTKINTNLKWANYVQEPKEIKLIEAYFENILLLMRNKIIMNGGDLDATKLIWFYPSSMMIYRRNMLESKWNDLYSKYITNKNEPLKLSESIAPFYYFNKKLGVSASDKPVVSMDIGGGTSDIVVYTNNKPQILTSFRFAANSIFGDAFNGSPLINGFVLKYYTKIENLLKENKQYDLLKVLDDIKTAGRSEDMMAFFFSLENNKKIKDQNIPISFNKDLAQDSDFKIIFLVFYASMIYHLANLMKKKGLAAPRYITFSGTGSKIVNIADGSMKLKALSAFTKEIFERIWGENIELVELKQFEEPKEITCKGGLMIDSEINVDVDKIKSVLLGDTNNVIVPDCSFQYQNITSDTEEEVMKEYIKFINLFFDIHNSFNYSNYFGVNPLYMAQYKEVLLEDAREFLKSGLGDKMKDLQGNRNIDLEETLFFYPLKGSINRLAYKIQTEIAVSL